MGEAEKIMEIMVKFKRKQKIKYTSWIAIYIIFTLFMIWRAVNV